MICNQWGGKKPFVSVVLILTLVVSGCSHQPQQGAGKAAASAELRFVDLQKFDRELHASLSSPLPQVEVAFFNSVTPNQIPERLQNWMSAVEDGGGAVRVIPPPSDLKPKDPFLLLSLVSTLWSASKAAKEMSTGAFFKSAHKYDAQIQLKTDAQGVSVVDKIIFVQRNKSAP
jgi:hypothetical protein